MPWMALLALLLSSLFDLAVPGSRLSGSVVDGHGAPVAGAEVRLLRWVSSGEGFREEARAWTTSAGAFRFSGLPAEDHDLLALAPGFAPQRLSVPVRKSEEPVPVKLVLRPGLTAAGTVVDGLGRPVAGARVELSRSRVSVLVPENGEEGLYRAVAGPDGRFEVPQVPAGRFDLEVRADGFAPLHRPGLQVPDLGTQVLERGTAVTGRVADSEGRPVPGVEIWVVPYELRDASRDWSVYYGKGPAATTGPEGDFEIPDLAPGEAVDLDLCKPGYLPVARTIPEAPGEPLEAVLEPAVRISGRVLDPGGAPVDGAQIQAWLSGEDPDGPRTARPCFRERGSALADADGRFELDKLLPGWWTVRASAKGWRSGESERRQIRGGESVDGLEIVLGEHPPGVVLGRVLLPDGTPVPGAQAGILEEGGAATIADRDGAYRLDRIEPGERTLYAVQSDRGVVESIMELGSHASEDLEVVPGENRIDLVLEPDGRREVRGKVLGPDGEPVAGADVQAGWKAATSAADGSFVLRLEDGAYTLWADREGYARAEQSVTVGGGPVEGIVLRLFRAGTIRGRLLGLSREALARARVELVLSPSSPSSPVDPLGGYRLDGVPPGVWKVSAHTGQRTAQGTVELAQDGDEAVLDLVFQPAWEVGGRVTGPGGEPVAGAWIRAVPHVGTKALGELTSSLPDGSFRMELEEGTYALLVRAQGLFGGTLLQTEVAGGPVEVEMRMRRAAALRGRIFGLEPGELVGQVRAEATSGGVDYGERDQESRYVFPTLHPGLWKVVATYADRKAVGWITIEEDQEEAFLDLVFQEE